MITVDNVRAAMKTTVVHLAASSTPAGRIGFSWSPLANTFAVRAYHPDGRLARETVGRSLEAMFAVFVEQIRAAQEPKPPAP